MSCNEHHPIHDSCSKIIDIRDVAENIYSIILEDPAISGNTLPGQFLMVRASEHQYFPLLRRAFSVARIMDNDRYELLIQGVGTGTQLLRKHQQGDCLKVVGPLGSHFDYESAAGKNVIIVVGGIGVAPAFMLYDKVRDIASGVKIFYGGRSSEYLVPMHDLEDVTVYATEDGSRGYKGYVTDLVKEEFEKNTENLNNIVVYSCGPNPMLSSLEEIVLKYNVHTEVSIETLMACGIGVCMGCPVEKRKHPGQYYYGCKDGPVFNINEITLKQTI
ncbi:MAG: dihydroorotate dehydrogenase electron transfer subunit [Calditrichia bacterium]